MKLLLLGFILLNSALASAEAVDMTTAQALFTQKVYPYMRKNCSECHSENAIYPVGPSHSHSNPSIAFQKFSKYVNFDEVGSSRLMKMVASKHFCTDYQYNCDRADQIVKEYSAMIAQYVLDVRKASLNKQAPRGDTASASTDTENNVVEPLRLTVYSSAAKVEKNYIMGTNVSVDQNILATLTFEEMGRGYVRLNSMTLTGKSGIYYAKGLHILINGQPTEKLTGFERVDRYFIFAAQKTQSIAWAHPVFKLSSNDTIQIAFEDLRKVDKFPSKMCAFDKIKKEDPYFWGLYGALKDTFNGPSFGFFGNTLEADCALLESKIDRVNYRRSVLLEEISKYSGGFNALEAVAYLIQATQ